MRRTSNSCTGLDQANCEKNISSDPKKKCSWVTHNALKLVENVVILHYLKILVPILMKHFAKDWKVEHQKLAF